MNKTQIISRANARTEKRAENVLDLDAEYFDALQEFCEEYRFAWRKKTAVFNTAAGTAVYDITLADGESLLTCDEMISVKLIGSDGTISEIPPIFTNEDEVVDSTTQGCPNGYFKASDTTLQLTPIPDAAYKIRINCWTVPAASIDSIPETVPLIPERYHRAIQKCMEKNIFEFSDPAKFQLAMLSYQKILADAIAKSDFAVGRVQTFQASDTAVRSTR